MAAPVHYGAVQDITSGAVGGICLLCWRQSRSCGQTKVANSVNAIMSHGGVDNGWHGRLSAVHRRSSRASPLLYSPRPESVALRRAPSAPPPCATYAASRCSHTTPLRPCLQLQVPSARHTSSHLRRCCGPPRHPRSGPPPPSAPWIRLLQLHGQHRPPRREWSHSGAARPGTGGCLCSQAVCA